MANQTKLRHILFDGLRSVERAVLFAGWLIRDIFLSTIIQELKAFVLKNIFLKLEDDIVTKSGFLSDMRKFIREKQRDNWFMLEFSELGFIGKVFKSSDLTVCINFFLMFSSKQPIDLLIIKILETRACDMNKKAVCIRMAVYKII